MNNDLYEELLKVKRAILFWEFKRDKLQEKIEKENRKKYIKSN